MATAPIKYVSDVTQGMLARLLAKENVTIQHGDFNTAFFDVKSRTLGIPRWKIPHDEKDLYDLLVGHEVGHALFTPPDSIELFKRRYPKIPFVVLNVVEDMRIENKIRDAYPGMISVFREGYKLFYDKQLLINPKQDITKLGMVDRINAHAKVGHFIDVPLSTAELALHDECQKTKTIEEVFAMCEKIYKHLEEEEKKKEEEKDQDPGDGDGEGKKDEKKDPKKDQKPKKKDPKKDDKSKDQKPKPSKPKDEKSEEEKEKERQRKEAQAKKKESEDGDTSEDEDESESEGESGDSDNEKDGDGDDDGDQDGEGQEGEGDQEGEGGPGDGDDGEDGDPSDEDGDGDPSEGEGGDDGDSPSAGAHNEFSNGCSMKENMEATTMKNMEEAMSNLQAQPTGAGTFFAPQKEALRNQIIPFEKLAEERKPLLGNLSNKGVYEDWINFKRQTMKHVSVLVKAFERKKSAWQYQRQSESQTGSINVDKLYQYKYDDHIFKSVTTLADAKSHGMLFLIDYSGSMSGHLSAVIDQVLNLVMFCNQVKIPFEVYSFTSHGYGHSGNAHTNTSSMVPVVANCCIVQLLKSSMPKKELEVGLRFLRAQSNGMSNRSAGSCGGNIPFATKYETMGGTPLMEAMMIFHEITKAFIDKYGVQKTIVNVLTDGDGCGLSFGHDSSVADKHVKRGVNQSERVGKFYGKNLTVGTGYSSGWNTDNSYATITRHLRETFGVIAVGFYIDAGGCRQNAENIIKRGVIAGAFAQGQKTPKDAAQVTHKCCLNFDKTHLAEVEEGFGFDKYFYISSRGSDLQIKNSEGITTRGNETPEQITAIFNETAIAKRKSRVLLESFIDIIA